jgi:hypothetical protein
VYSVCVCVWPKVWGCNKSKKNFFSCFAIDCCYYLLGKAKDFISSLYCYYFLLFLLLFGNQIRRALQLQCSKPSEPAKRLILVLNNGYATHFLRLNIFLFFGKTLWWILFTALAPKQYRRWRKRRRRSAWPHKSSLIENRQKMFMSTSRCGGISCL